MLPHEAAEQLTDLARQQCSTIDGVVADMLEDWLEQRRKEARLGRKDQAQGRYAPQPQMVPGIDDPAAHAV
jgi:hypothetical protein